MPHDCKLLYNHLFLGDLINLIKNVWCVILHFGRQYLVALNLPSLVHTTQPDEPLSQVVLRKQENKTTG